MQKILETRLSNYKTAIARDIFVFCVFTGLSYSDVKSLTYDDIQVDSDEVMWIINRRVKTGTLFQVKLLPVARQLIDKYRYLSLPGNVVFPVKSLESYRKSLKTMARQSDFSYGEAFIRYDDYFIAGSTYRNRIENAWT